MASTHDATPADLPTPDERPGSDVVIYDGGCGLCLGISRLLQRIDGKGRLSFLSLYDRRVGERFPDLARDDLLEHVYVIEPSGARHKGASAVRYLARRLPALWWAVPVLFIPGSLPVWKWFYALFSKHRHRLSRLARLEPQDDRAN